MGRHNFYKHAHKGIRAVADRLVGLAGRTDFLRSDEVVTLQRSLDEAFAVFEAHAAHETEFITPLVRACAPPLAAESDAEHRAQELRLRELREALALAAAAGPSAPTVGHGFVVALSRFQGEMLVHMADEEETLMSALWAAYDDTTLREVERALVASLPPAEKLANLRWMLPALNGAERAELLGGVQRSAPASVLAAVWTVAHEVLPAEEWALLGAEPTAAA
jgi:hypothetical protein